MTTRANVSAPTSVIHTDDAGKIAAGVATVPPVSGTDAGLQVYANLGSQVIPVSQTLSGAPNLGTTQTALNSSTATLIVAARTTRRSVLVINTSTSVTVYVGNSGVTSSTGLPLTPGGAITIPVNCALYAISASSTPSVSVGEAYD